MNAKLGFLLIGLLASVCIADGLSARYENEDEKLLNADESNGYRQKREVVDIDELNINERSKENEVLGHIDVIERSVDALERRGLIGTIVSFPIRIISLVIRIMLLPFKAIFRILV